MPFYGAGGHAHLTQKITELSRWSLPALCRYRLIGAYPQNKFSAARILPAYSRWCSTDHYANYADIADHHRHRIIQCSIVPFAIGFIITPGGDRVLCYEKKNAAGTHTYPAKQRKKPATF